MKKRELIPYGYRLFNGAIMPNQAVDSYNRMQRDINAFIESGMTVPEYLLNGSHNLIASIVNAQPNKEKAP